MVGVVDEPSPIPRRRGRPARHLLGGIAVCGVCGAATRVGTQNTGARQSPGDQAQPSRYRVYECAGSTGSRGFHVSMRQEHLDQIVTDAVLARISRPDFQTPRTTHEDQDGSERRALRLKIKGHRVWLDTVRKEADRRDAPLMLAHQERVVFPKIRAALARIEALDELDPLTTQLRDSSSVWNAWNRMRLPEQRHIVRLLVTPRINPVLPEDRGRQGLNTHRVDLDWR